MRLALIAVFLYLIYAGFDGLKGDDDLKKISMGELIKDGVGDSRYLEITGCYSKGDIVYKYSPKSPNKVTDIIFPVIDSAAFIDAIINEMALEFGDEDSSIKQNKDLNKTMLLIKRDPNKFSSTCISQGEDHTCLDDLLTVDSISPFSIKGTVQLGLNDVDSETRKLISSLNYNVSDKVIFLEENTEPKGKALSFFMILGGFLGIGFVGYSYYRSRS